MMSPEEIARRVLALGPRESAVLVILLTSGIAACAGIEGIELQSVATVELSPAARATLDHILANTEGPIAQQVRVFRDAVGLIHDGLNPTREDNLCTTQHAGSDLYELARNSSEPITAATVQELAAELSAHERFSRGVEPTCTCQECGDVFVGESDCGFCRICGCTEESACSGGCEWVDHEHTLCSRCV